MASALASLVQKYQITPKREEQLFELGKNRVVFVVDDSSSMRGERWDEVSVRTLQMLEIATAVTQPVDVRFLNQQSYDVNATSAQINWPPGPQGGTPILEACTRALVNTRDPRPVLFVILTDGEPQEVDEFVDFVQYHTTTNKHSFNFLVCTDDLEQVTYLNRLDRSSGRVDVIDDYKTEQKQCPEGLTLGDYYAKSLLGAIVPELDVKDEPSLTPLKAAKEDEKDVVGSCGCCVIS